MSLRWTAYVSPTPQRGSKMQIDHFSSKSVLLSKKVCCKVSLCENFQRQSCKAFTGLSSRWSFQVRADADISSLLVGRRQDDAHRVLVSEIDRHCELRGNDQDADQWTCARTSSQPDTGICQLQWRRRSTAHRHGNQRHHHHREYMDNVFNSVNQSLNCRQSKCWISRLICQSLRRLLSQVIWD